MTETNKNQGDSKEPIENNSDAYIERAITYHSEGDYNRAITTFNKAIKLDPNNANAYKNRGIAYGSEDDNRRAITDFDKTIELDPNDADAYAWRGITYNAKRCDDSAISDFNKAIELNPNDAENYEWRGISYYFTGDYNRAITDFNKAIVLAPNKADVYEWRGYAYYFNKNYALSLDSFLESNKRDSSLKLNDIFVYIAFRLKNIKKNRGKIFNICYDLSLAIQEIRNKLFYKPGRKREIAHYTSFHTLKNLAREEGCFRIYNAAYMNDPEEGEVFSTIMKQYGINFIDDFYPSRVSYISPAYIGSFVSVNPKEEQKDKLFLWRIYGKHDEKEAEGACLIFKHNEDCFTPMTIIDAMHQRRDMTSRKRPVKLALYKIAYKSQVDRKLKEELTELARLLKKIKTHFSNKNLPKLVSELLDEIRFLFKEDHYKEEKEVRVVRVCYFKEENKKQESDEIEIDTEQIPPRFYLETDKSLRFHEVILGPNTKNPSEWKKWLKQQRDDLVITPSNAKYRNS